MNINELITRTSQRAKELPILAGVPVIDEDKGDVSNKLQSSVSKTKAAVIVGWDGFDADPTSSKTVFGTARVVVSVFEHPVVNRKGTGAPTALNMAQEIAKELNIFKAGPDAAPLVFKKITPLNEIAGGVIACDVVFNVKAEL